jgi:hypothetical protein
MTMTTYVAAEHVMWVMPQCTPARRLSGEVLTTDRDRRPQ